MTLKQKLHIDMQILIIKGKKLSLEYLKLKQQFDAIKG